MKKDVVKHKKEMKMLEKKNNNRGIEEDNYMDAE